MDNQQSQTDLPKTQGKVKSPSPDKNLEPEDSSNSSREMCAYCDTSITVSSKFYNITNMGDLEYIGRRLNHLGPKKNNFCDRVCKRHYDLNLKRDKAHRQYNAKRERLPGIDVILGTKKHRTDPPQSVQGPGSSIPVTQTLSLSLNEYNNPNMQSHRLGNWYHTPPHPSIQDLRPPVMSSQSSILQNSGQAQGTTTTIQSATDSHFRTNVFPYIAPQRGIPWVWDPNRPAIPGDAPSLQTEPLLATEPSSDLLIPLSTGSLADSPSSIIDLVAHHMTNIISLFSHNADHTSVFDSIKQNQQRQVSVAINALCTQTYRALAKIKQEEYDEKPSQSQIRSSVRDLMIMLLKREKREDILLKGDDEINSLFIEWVNLQKSQQGNE